MWVHRSGEGGFAKPCIMLVSKARERDFVGNKVPQNMIAAEERLEWLSNATIRDAESWGWSEEN